MAVPDYQTLMVPVLEALADGEPRSVSDLRAAVAKALDLTDASAHLRDECGGTGRFGEVADDADLGTGLASRALDALRVPSRDDHARALRREEPRGLEPDPRRRAGDDADASVHSQVHRGR